MIDIAKLNGSLAAKIVGSGGGGSVVCLSNDKNISLKIIEEYNKIGVKEAFIANKGSAPKTFLND
jgi:galactokinase